MNETVIIGNDFRYLVIQALGWDYNLWSVILAAILCLVVFFGIIFVIGFIGMLLDL